VKGGGTRPSYNLLRRGTCKGKTRKEIISHSKIPLRSADETITRIEEAQWRQGSVPRKRARLLLGVLNLQRPMKANEECANSALRPCVWATQRRG